MKLETRFLDNGKVSSRLTVFCSPSDKCSGYPRPRNLVSALKYSKSIYIKKDVTGVLYNFPSITSLVKYFDSINSNANRNKIASCLNT